MCFPSFIRGFEVTGCHAFKLTGSLHPYSAGASYTVYHMYRRGAGDDGWKRVMDMDGDSLGCTKL